MARSCCARRAAAHPLPRSRGATRCPSDSAGSNRRSIRRRARGAQAPEPRSIRCAHRLLERADPRREIAAARRDVARESDDAHRVIAWRSRSPRDSAPPRLQLRVADDRSPMPMRVVAADPQAAPARVSRRQPHSSHELSIIVDVEDVRRLIGEVACVLMRADQAIVRFRNARICCAPGAAGGAACATVAEKRIASRYTQEKRTGGSPTATLEHDATAPR